MLQPESVLSYDLGFKIHSGNWQSEAFVFLLDYRDKISSVATGEITETGRTVVRSENLAEAFSGDRGNYGNRTHSCSQ
jgi:outer membrane receptor for ferrienterochelin and colicin